MGTKKDHSYKKGNHIMRSGEEDATETSVKQFIWLRQVEKGNETVTGYTIL